MADEERLPADESERRRIREERADTLFVEAGAGSGKTRALVDRIEALVIDDGIEMESIAAITFTEKAAAELRDRIRQRFEGAASERARAAIEQLDSAAVGTLHSFAQRILNEHPVEAGLPPGVEVLDEIGSQVEFENRWRVFLDELLDDPSVARSLLIFDAAGVRLDALRTVAAKMAENWDLVEDRMSLHAPAPPPFDRHALLRSFDAVLALRHHCTDPADALLARFGAVEANRTALAEAFAEFDAIAAATEMGTRNAARRRVKPGNTGRAANWPDPKAVREAVSGLAEACDDAVAVATTGALDHLGARLARFVLDAAEQRRASGRLEFHDLLVRARRLLRDEHHGPEVRAALRRRYTRLLLDEFQDTDPIQIELAVLISTTEADVAERDWTDLPVESGRLFLVGDP